MKEGGPMKERAQVNKGDEEGERQGGTDGR